MNYQTKLIRYMPVNIGLTAGSLTSAILLIVFTHLKTPIYWIFFLCLSTLFVLGLTLTAYPYMPDVNFKKIILSIKNSRLNKFQKLKIMLIKENHAISAVRKIRKIKNMEIEALKQKIVILEEKVRRRRTSTETRKAVFWNIKSILSDRMARMPLGRFHIKNKNKMSESVQEETLTEEVSEENKKELASNLKKKYPTLPEELSMRIELERFVARMIQTEKKKFSISQILSSIIKNYPIADSIRNKISTELKKWISEDPFIRQVSVENGVRYYKII